MVDLSILIVNYRTKELLGRCLECLLGERGHDLAIEVIVVDNASNDGCAELLSREFPDVTFVQNEFNYGFAVANNQAFRRSEGRYVMPLNPDTEVAPNALKTLVAFLDATPRAAIACPILVEDEGKFTLPMTRFYEWDVALLRVLRTRMERLIGPTPLPDRPFLVDWTWTTGYVCRRAAIPRDQLFSEDMFLFGEEYDLCRGLRDRGFQIYMLPAAHLRHHTSVTWSRTPEHIAVARRLGMAVLWEIRRREFGRVSATLSQALLGSEAAVVWALLRGKALMTGRRRPVIDADYAAQVDASLHVCLEGGRYVRRINDAARRYFNDGQDPPPLTEGRTGALRSSVG